MSESLSLYSDPTFCFQRRGCTVFPFGYPVKTLSTSAWKGGLRTDLKYALNINCQGYDYESEMQEETYELELARQIRECEIDPEKATALSTAAWTELSAVCERSFRDLTVKVVVSGGVDHNAVAPGDPTSYYEENGQYVFYHPGTVNTFVLINQNLTDGAMVRALMVASEAKAAAIQELMIGSCYSSSIATGSGTDGCVIAARMDASQTLTDASGHAKLGELIGAAVKEAVKSALLRQTAANGARQFKVLERVRRYGITAGSLYDQYVRYRDGYGQLGIAFSGAADFERVLHSWNQNTNLVLLVSLYVHLLDQRSWGLILSGEVLREGAHLLRTGLYVGQGRFLGDCYTAKDGSLEPLPDEGTQGDACEREPIRDAFCMEEFSTNSEEARDPIHLLVHYLVLFLGIMCKGR